MICQLYLYVIIDNFDFDKQRYDNNPNYSIFVSGLLRTLANLLKLRAKRQKNV